MKKIVVLLLLIKSTLIYPQLAISGGVDYASLTAGSFKSTKLEKNKYWFNGWFIDFGYLDLGKRLEEDGAEWLLHYYNRKAITELNGKEYQLTNGEVSSSWGGNFFILQRLIFSIIGELGIGWISSDTPYDHSGVYGTMSIGVGPSILISRIRLFALAKLNLGYIYFSSSDPDPNLIEMSKSSSGLLSGPEIKIGAGFIF